MPMEPQVITGVFAVEVEMQRFTFSITDLTTFESVPHVEWAEKEDLLEIGTRFARAMLAANATTHGNGPQASLKRMEKAARQILIFSTEVCAWQFTTKLGYRCR